MACVCGVAYQLLFVACFQSYYSNEISDAQVDHALDITLCIRVTNMKWAARKCHLVRKHDVRVFQLSTHCVQDGSARLDELAGLLALVLSDKKAACPVWNLFLTPESIPCLLEYDTL